VPNFYPKKLFQFVVLCNIYPYTVIANPLSFLLHSSKKQYFRNVLYFSVTLPVKTDRLVLSNPQLALYDPTVHAKLHLTHPNLPQILLFLWTVLMCFLVFWFRSLSLNMFSHWEHDSNHGYQ
jgi:hypothetical protein